MPKQPPAGDSRDGSGEQAGTSGRPTPGRWPAPRYEELSWDAPRTTWPGMPTLPRPGRPYRAFVPTAIASLTWSPTAETAAVAEEAVASIARFDQKYGEHVSPFASIMLRAESMSSSQIENVTASARALGEAELGVTDRRNATLVVGNVRAMQAALHAADTLKVDDILAMHRALMLTDERHTPGVWRTEQVWIGARADTPIGADFVPPHHERVPAAMEDLAAYARRRDQPTMVQVAIAHAQFETIHPFTDGNGRTGRALMHTMLRRLGIAAHLSVPVSAGLLSDIRGYHDALTAYRDGDPDPIVRLCSEAALRSVANGEVLAERVRAVTAGWEQRLTARRDAAAWRVLPLLARRPVINPAALRDELGLDYMRQKRAMDALEEAGIVVGVDKYKRGRFWRSPELLAELDEFAARARRGRLPPRATATAARRLPVPHT